ncbi:MAG: CDP-alcohol phosphatidyltransferase family protein [candidate division KSB1 bacterium]|nr:CDP-alcohol phosphatidyltransferase family protein [candidate division KSB1 bacterium]
MSQIELTLKPRDIEEGIDLRFFRPLGFAITRMLARTKIRPTDVTVASLVIGAGAGHLLYYENLWINLAGMIGFVIADLLDSVDGQLARLKCTRSHFGRTLDGVAGAVIFTSIYFHLALRLFHAGASPLIFFLAAVALASQAMQNSIADYYRNAYVAYGLRGPKGDLDSTEALRRQYNEIKQSGSMMQKLLLRLYINYTARQEFLTPQFQRLRQLLAKASLDEQRLAEFAGHYRRLNRPLLKHYSWLATNLRMLIVFGLIFVNQSVWYFWFNVIVLNAFMALLIWLHERHSRRLMLEIG